MKKVGSYATCEACKTEQPVLRVSGEMRIIPHMASCATGFGWCAGSSKRVLEKAVTVHA